jgi:hypothetical protein
MIEAAAGDGFVGADSISERLSSLIDMPMSNLGPLFAIIPNTLRDDLINAFNEVARNFRERRWEPSELNGGKLCEVAYTILRGHVDGTYPARSSKPTNMVDACRTFEKANPALFPRSVRVQIPRILLVLYEIRKNRGVGHVGGDVDPNCMDATAVLAMSKWILAELVRLFHGVDTTVAESAIEQLTERTLQLVWKVESELRVLATAMTMKQKSMLLLYQTGGWSTRPTFASGSSTRIHRAIVVTSYPRLTRRSW